MKTKNICTFLQFYIKYLIYISFACYDIVQVSHRIVNIFWNTVYIKLMQMKQFITIKPDTEAYMCLYILLE